MRRNVLSQIVVFESNTTIFSKHHSLLVDFDLDSEIYMHLFGQEKDHIAGSLCRLSHVSCVPSCQNLPHIRKLKYLDLRRQKIELERTAVQMSCAYP